MGYSCAKCHDQNMLEGVRVVDRTLEECWLSAASDLKVEVETNPTARIFKGVVGFSLKANVCGTCGYTELFVTEPMELGRAYSRSVQSAG
ncbi:MAG: hypothetical protein RH917_10180 [Lacipirellulaceae bacterium]